ncbi:MAG: DNA methyltransferase [Terriglobales bacterium]
MEWREYCNPENWHPYANLFPQMDSEQLDSLATNIEKHGLQEPIKLFEGKVLDGRNRLKACEKAAAALREAGKPEVKPRFVQWHPNGVSALDYVIAENLERRHLTTSQRAALAAELIPQLEKEARARQKEAGKYGRQGGRGHKKGNAKPSAQNKAKGKSAARAAAMFGVSSSSVETARRVAKKNPTLLREMKAGRISLPRADRQAHFKGTLADQFGAEPFTVLDAKKGYWEARKEFWAMQGATGGHINQPKESQQVQHSKFDPVFAECVYRWFCPPNGRVLDPCAGEHVKGIVAAKLGLDYTGLELRPEQVEANREQAALFRVTPKWLECDSSDAKQFSDCIADKTRFDLVFTSPPYYDLEVYSDSKSDISSLETYDKFMERYENIFAQAVSRLKPNRFLVVKVGEIRDKKTGFCRNFVGDNISCFLKLGLNFYNQAVLATKVWNAATHVGNQFPNYRKLVSTHQTVLVFFKGDNPRVIPAEFGILGEQEYGVEK